MLLLERVGTDERSGDDVHKRVVPPHHPCRDIRLTTKLHGLKGVRLHPILVTHFAGEA